MQRRPGWEVQLQAIRDDAEQELARMTYKAREAVRARNLALKRYRKAELALVEHREAKERGEE